MKIKIIKQDGSKAEVEIDGAIDFQGMGVLSPDEVTALKTRALAEGKTAAERAAQEKLDAAERKLADFEASLTDRQRNSVKSEERIAAMEKTVQEMRANMEAAQKSSQEATIAKTLADARSGLAFTDGGQTIFDMQMREKMQPDGTFLLATGERGTIDQARMEWASSPVGKALIKTQANGGAGTGPTSIMGASFADIVKDNKLKAEYVKTHGEAKYTADYLAFKKSQQK